MVLAKSRFSDASFLRLAALLAFGLALFYPRMAYALPPQNGPAIGLTSNWHLDDTGRGTYKDSYSLNYYNVPPGSGFHGEYDGVCSQAAGKACPAPIPAGFRMGAQAFNGRDTGIDIPIPDGPDYMFNWASEDSFTIEFWLRRSALCSTDGGSDDDEVIVGRDYGDGLQWWIGLACNQNEGPPNRIKFKLTSSIGDEAVSFSQTAITDTAWHHVVAVRDGVTGDNRIYLDGVLEDSVSRIYAGDFSDFSRGINIGYLNADNGYHFEGLLDEIAIYNRTLSDKEIATHYNSGNGLFTLPIRILPIGDSITRGEYICQDPDFNINCTGYRASLWNMLTDASLSVDFVGDQGGFYQYQYHYDNNHIGYGGWTDSAIASIIYDRLSIFRPSVLLLHIGTNSLSENPYSVEDILNEVDRFEFDYGTSVTVILARIITRENYETTFANFNTNVVNMATPRINGVDGGTPIPGTNPVEYWRQPGVPDKIRIVNMEPSLITLDHLPDGIHPNAAGYNIMAQVWFDELAQILDPSAGIVTQKLFVEQGALCGGKTPCFDSIQAAIDATTAGQTIINISDQTYRENLTINNPGARIMLRGGWDADFRSQPSVTSVMGTIEIHRGSIAPTSIQIIN